MINTARVQKMLRMIKASEAKEAKLERIAAAAQARVEAQKKATLKLKQMLVQELGATLPSGRGKMRAAGRAPRGALTQAVIKVFADGRPHRVKEVRAAVAAKGFGVAAVPTVIAYQVKRGVLRRRRRGLYVKA